MTLTPFEIGERRHEQCRYGIFSQTAFESPDMGETWVAACPIPLCAFTPAEPVPPALKRRWGGDVEFHRDCAVCPAYSPLTVTTTDGEGPSVGTDGPQSGPGVDQ